MLSANIFGCYYCYYYDKVVEVILKQILGMRAITVFQCCTADSRRFHLYHSSYFVDIVGVTGCCVC